MQKIIGISILRLISCIFIITCHIFQFYNFELAWWFNVGVEIFLLISGFLYSKKKIKTFSFLFKNLLKILLDYSIFLFLFFLFLYPKQSIYNYFLSYIGYNKIDGLGHLWYIPIIIICYLITPIIYKIKKYGVINLGILIVLLEILFIILRFNSGIYIICYIIGYFLGEIEKYLFNREYIVKLLILTFFINILKIYYFYLEVNRTNIFYRLGHILLGITIFIIILNIFKNKKISKNLEKILNISDKYSYNIYLSHHIYILGPYSLLRSNNVLIGIILVGLFTTITSFILIELSKTLKFIIFELVKLLKYKKRNNKEKNIYNF